MNSEEHTTPTPDLKVFLDSSNRVLKRNNILWAALLSVLIVLLGIITYAWYTEHGRAEYWRGLFIDQCIEDTGCDVEEELDQAQAVGQEGPPGAQGIPGPQGEPGLDGRNGRDGVDGADGEDGEDGTNGTNGTNGVDGADGTDGTNGLDGPAGPPGPPGQDGQNGQDGQDGTNGVDGVSIVRIYCDNSVLTYELSNGVISPIEGASECTLPPPVEPQPEPTTPPVTG